MAVDVVDGVATEAGELSCRMTLGAAVVTAGVKLLMNMSACLTLSLSQVLVNNLRKTSSNCN